MNLDEIPKSALIFKLFKKKKPKDGDEEPKEEDLFSPPKFDFLRLVREARDKITKENEI